MCKCCDYLIFVVPKDKSEEKDEEKTRGGQQEEEITLQQLQKVHEEVLKAKEAQLAVLERRLEEAEKRAPGSFETSGGEVLYRIVLGKVEEPSTLVEKRL